jgi:hypothetical protein
VSKTNRQTKEVAARLPPDGLLEPCFRVRCAAYTRRTTTKQGFQSLFRPPQPETNKPAGRAAGLFLSISAGLAGIFSVPLAAEALDVAVEQPVGAPSVAAGWDGPPELVVGAAPCVAAEPVLPPVQDVEVARPAEPAAALHGARPADELAAGPHSVDACSVEPAASPAVAESEAAGTEASAAPQAAADSRCSAAAPARVSGSRDCGPELSLLGLDPDAPLRLIPGHDLFPPMARCEPPDSLRSAGAADRGHRAGYWEHLPCPAPATHCDSEGPAAEVSADPCCCPDRRIYAAPAKVPAG